MILQANNIHRKAGVATLISISETANRYMKRCLTSLVIREIESKTTMRSHLTPVNVTIINKTSDGVVVVKKGPLFTTGGNIDWYNHY